MGTTTDGCAPTTRVALPALGTTGAARLPPQALTYWRVHAALAALTVGLITSLAFAVVLPKYMLPWGLVALAVIASVFAIEILIYLPLRFRNYSYTIDSSYVHLARGKLFRRSVIIPCDRVLNVGSVQGPIMRRMHLTALGITTLLDVEHFGPFPEDLVDDLRDRILNRSTRDGTARND